MAFGDLATVLGTFHNGIVHRLGLMTDEQFNGSYALATAAPGPNSLLWPSPSWL